MKERKVFHVYQLGPGGDYIAIELQPEASEYTINAIIEKNYGRILRRQGLTAHDLNCVVIRTDTEKRAISCARRSGFHYTGLSEALYAKLNPPTVL